MPDDALGMIEKAPLPPSVSGEICLHRNPPSIAWRKIDICQPLVDAIVAHADAQTNGACAVRIEGHECAQHAATWQRQRNRQPAGDGCDDRWTRLSVNLQRRDLETVGWSFLSVVNFAQQIDDRDGSVLDVTAAGA